MNNHLKFGLHRGYIPVLAASAFCATLACPAVATAAETAVSVDGLAASLDVAANASQEITAGGEGSSTIMEGGFVSSPNEDAGANLQDNTGGTTGGTSVDTPGQGDGISGSTSHVSSGDGSEDDLDDGDVSLQVGDGGSGSSSTEGGETDPFDSQGESDSESLNEDDPADPDKGDGESDLTDPEESDTPEKPQNGWWKDPATGKLVYFVNGQETVPNKVWYVDENGTPHWYENGKEVAANKVWYVDDQGNRHWYENGKEVAADKVWYTDSETGERTYYLDGKEAQANLVWYTDPVTGERFWYEKGKWVEEHAFYDKVTDAWYWADKGGVVARGKDVYIPVSNTDRSKGKWVRIADDYKMVKGEQYAKSKDDGKMHWWYFDPVTGEMMKNFNYIKADGKWKWVYYDDVMGWMVYGQQYRPSSKTDKAYHWYYFDEHTGATQYGWKWIETDKKTVYYDDVMGWMVYRWHYTPNAAGHGNRTNWHFFDRYTGALMTHNDRGNSAYESYQRIRGGHSKTNKFITVDKDNFRTVIFEKRGGDWDVIQVYKCGLGMPSANNGRGTQEGFYYLGENRPSSKRPSGVSWRGDHDRLQSDPSSGVDWRVHYVWDQGFHSVVHGISTPPEKQLERYISDGCVRLLDADAKWLYQNCSNGTRVYIYKRY